MINLITGRPGGGKSYEAVAYHVVKAIKEKRKVITNLPLNLEVIEKVFGSEALELIKLVKVDLHDYGNSDRPFSKPEHYKDDWRNEDGQGAHVIVDECHMVIPARGCSTEVLEFLSMHRHFGIDITFITQSNKKIHRDVRDMVELEYRCIKATALGSNDKYIKKVHMGCNGSVVNEEIRTYDKTYFPFYQSHTASNSSVKEAAAKDIKPFYKHWLFYFFIVIVIAFIYSIYNLVTMDSTLMGGAKKVDEIAVTESVPEGIPTEVEHLPEAPVKKVKEVFEHPLQIFGFQPTGYSDFSLKNGDKRSYHQIVYIDLLLDGKVVNSMTSDDLAVMGYQFIALTDCVYRVRYDGNDLGVSVCKIKKEKQKDTVGDVLKDFNPMA